MLRCPTNFLVARAQSIHSCNRKFCAKSEAKRSTDTFWGRSEHRHAKQFKFNVCFKDKCLAKKHDKVNIIDHKFPCKLLLNKYSDCNELYKHSICFKTRECRCPYKKMTRNSQEMVGLYMTPTQYGSSGPTDVRIWQNNYIENYTIEKERGHIPSLENCALPIHSWQI